MTSAALVSVLALLTAWAPPPAPPPTTPSAPASTPSTTPATSGAASSGAASAARSSDAPLEAGKPAPIKLAVYDVDAKTVSPVVARVVTDAVVLEIRKLEGVTVIGMDEVRAMLDLEAQKALVGCADESCVAEIAEGLGVDGIVIGNLAVVGDETVFGLKRIDQRQAKTVGQFSQRVKGTKGSECLALVGVAVEKLFPDHPLLPGQQRGVSPQVAVRLDPPPLDTWVFWTGAAASAALGVVAGGAGVMNGLAYSHAQQITDKSIGGAAVSAKDVGADVSIVRTTFAVAVGAGGVAVIAAVATGVAGLFTDWEGYRAQNEAAAAQKR